MQWLRLTGITLWLLLLFLLVFCTQTTPGRAGFKTLLLVPQLLPAPPVKPLEWFYRTPERTEVTFPTVSGYGVADLYRIPYGRTKAGVLLFLGVNPAGRDDPRVVNLGEALARAGFVVMIPWSERMVEGRLDKHAPSDLVLGFMYLQGRDDVDDERVGMAGFCVGASMAMVAAADPRIQDQVSFVNSFGGYYDLRDQVAQVASHTSFYDGLERPWNPSHQTREVFATELLEGLDDPEEQAALQRLFSLGVEALPDRMVDLSPEAQAVYHLLRGPTLEQAKTLLAQLPSHRQEAMAGLSPSLHIGELKARVLIMHDREDDNVPSEESYRLADALKERGDFRLTEFSLFQHMDPTRPVGFFTFVGEAIKLYRHLYDIIAIAN